MDNLSETLKNLDNKLSSKFSTTIKTNSTTSEFNIKFPIPLILNNSLNYELGLLWFSTYNAIYNIGAYTFKLSDLKKDNLRTPNEIFTMTPGAYEISEIGLEMKSQIRRSNFFSKRDIVLEPKISLHKCILKTDVLILFSKDLANVLGFKSTETYLPGTHLGERMVNINSVSDINIECDLIQGCYNNGVSSNLLYSFPSNTVPSGYKLTERMNPPIYIPINRKEISNIHIRIVDQNDKIINLNGENISMYLHLRQV